MGGYTCNAYLYCNTGGKCTSLDWGLNFNPSSVYTLTLANKFNREYRYAKAYLAASGNFYSRILGRFRRRGDAGDGFAERTAVRQFGLRPGLLGQEIAMSLGSHLCHAIGISAFHDVSEGVPKQTAV